MTTLYLRDAAPTNDPGETERSTALPVGTFSDFAIAVKSLSETIGALETSVSGSSLAQTAHQDNFFTSFSSLALGAQTIDANTWTIGLDVGEGNANANSFLVLSIYVFREPSTIVGFIYDSDTALGTEWVTTGAGRVVTVSGSAVTALANDYIVLEVWRHASQAMAAAYTQTLYYNGDTKVTEGSITSAGSYIETPQVLGFLSAPQFMAAIGYPMQQPVLAKMQATPYGQSIPRP